MFTSRSGLLPLLFTILLRYTAFCNAAASFADLKANFQRPGVPYGPHVFWHWVNGNVNEEGLDADLEALAANGFGGAMIYDVNAGIPQGPVAYDSNEWLRLLVHSVDGLAKKGMLAAMHNAPGYSGIGSSSLPVNKTMKELVWTETRISANGSTGATTLQSPFSKLGVYEDLFVLAYPAQPGEGVVFRDAVSGLSINDESQDLSVTQTIDRDHPLRISSSSEHLDIAMKQAFTAQAIAIYRIPETPKNAFDGSRDYPPSWKLQVSNDSSTWTAVSVSGNYPALRQMDAPAVLTFAPVVGRYFRLQPSGPTWVTGIDISSSARLPNWAVKAHGAPGSVADMEDSLDAANAIDPDTVLDLTEKINAAGKLNWRPQNGTYTVVRMGYTVTAQEMAALPESQSGALSVDLFDKTAIDAHFETHLSRIIDALKPYIPETFYGFEVDSYELGMQNWGGGLEDSFQSLRNYSLRPWILSATGRILGSPQLTERFLYDFRLTHANLMASNCYGYMQSRLTEHELSFLIEPYGDGPFDSMELASVVDSAYGEFWAHYTYGSDAYSQLGQSSSDIRAMNLVPSEAFTGQPDVSAWTEYPYQLKGYGDRIMTLGPNRFFMHTYVSQPVDIAFPGMTFGPFGLHVDRMNTWIEEQDGWNEYIRRASFLSQNSRPVTQILCFLGEEPRPSATATYAAPYLVPLEYQADIFSRSNLLNLSANNGKAAYPSGTEYGLLIFPEMEAAIVPALNKIMELANGGVPMLLPATKPSRSLSLWDSDSDVDALASDLWAMADNVTIFLGVDTPTVIQKTGIAPNLLFTAVENDAAIYYSHRMVGDESVYFIDNGLRKRVHTVVDVLGSGSPEIWDPLTGQIITRTVSSAHDGRVSIALNLDPSQALFIRLRNDGVDGSTAFSSISKDGMKLISASPLPDFDPTPWMNVSSDFTVELWAKPEIAQFGTTGYLFYPYAPSTTYGTGQALSSIAMGWNGIQLGEATTAGPTTVFSRTYDDDGFTVSGWTHVAVVYRANTPSLYINGALVGSGDQSSSIVHPGLDTPDSVEKMTDRFVGDISGLKVLARALSASEISAAYSRGVPPPPSAPPLEILGSSGILIRENGAYLFSGASNQSNGTALTVRDATKRTLNNTWTVDFPADRMPPDVGNVSITLSSLRSLKDYDDFDVAHFSGTATYKTTFRTSVSNNSDLHHTSFRYLLDLGRVENVARVSVNGQDLGLVWVPPYEIDITSALDLGGPNQLTVEVTNNWPNRLIGDEHLPAEASYNSTREDFSVNEWPSWFQADLNGTSSLDRKPGERVTFAAWKHYNASDPLFESGLLGPVILTRAVVLHL